MLPWSPLPQLQKRPEIFVPYNLLHFHSPHQLLLESLVLLCYVDEGAVHTWTLTNATKNVRFLVGQTEGVMHLRTTMVASDKMRFLASQTEAIVMMRFRTTIAE
ncbi:hypothetical protein A2U01_0010896, partial [Trifolium medium]|nr:hypothetical protein [Trifolium medium]